MTRFVDREKVFNLRKQGMSYSQIKKVIPLSKSTLSRWLRNLPLTKERIRELRDNNAQRIERYRETRRRNWEKRLNSTLKEERKKLIPLTNKQLYLAGLLLYWGEGLKSLKGSVSLNNTDPKIVKFYLYWLIRVLKVNKKNLKVYIHLYDDMDINKEIHFWSTELNIPLTQFNKPYIKKSKREWLNQKGFSHGTCTVIISNVLLKEKIMMGIRAIADYYYQRI
jgi:hypothetical protein